MNNWIIAATIGFFALIVIYIDRYVLISLLGGAGVDIPTFLALLEGDGWESFGIGLKAFFITSLILMGIAVYLILIRSVLDRKRQEKILVKNWIMAAVIGIVVLVVGYIDSIVLIGLLEGGEWKHLGTSFQVFFIASIVFMAIAAIAALLYEKIRNY